MTEPVIIGNATLYCAPSEDMLPTLPDNSVDSVVTDPPYGLGFMGKKWDIGVPAVDLFRECLRVLKPGGHLLAFGGARTYHRLAVAVEDAGFEIRDQIMWIYGSGFPKSQNVSKAIDKAAGAERPIVGTVRRWGNNASAGRGGQYANDYQPTELGAERFDPVTAPATDDARQWDGWGTALKPAHEPILVARKPLEGTVAANVMRHGTGAINVDGCRVDPTGESRERSGETSQDRRYTEEGAVNFAAKPGIRGGAHAGRWPANVIHDGSEEVVSLFPKTASNSGAPFNRHGDKRRNTFGKFDGGHAVEGFYGDLGSAARFFYCAKASRKDRNEGCEALDERPLLWSSGTQAPGTFQAEGTKRAANNNHPTVKPTELMRYLCRLVTPPGGTVLDPFMGSGSTGKAAVLEGFAFIGIDKDKDYFPIAIARIDHCQQQGRLAI